MNSTAENNKRIAKNTAMLYIRMLVIMAVTLYTSRVVLEVLGVEDFGIYNVVGGVVAMFSILSGSLSAAISRFITFELGKGEKGQLKEVFSSAITIQLGLSMIVILLAETIGVWFLNCKMNISPDRLYAANWVLQCSLLTFAMSLISVPYNASIIAHEHMKAFAYISILDIFLKLFSIIFLKYIPLCCDELIAYSLLLLCVSIIIRFVYYVYCRKNFKECAVLFSLSKKNFVQMLKFAGWNFIGASSAILKNQGVNILLNLFAGSLVNAARGIAVQVHAAVLSFCNSFTTALNPQITKKFAADDREYAIKLSFLGARLSFYLMTLISLPLLIETKQILILWLNYFPDYTIIFVRLMLLDVLIESLSLTMITLMLATGRIRNYQLLVGGFQLLNFPLSFLFLHNGYGPEYAFFVSIFLSICCLFLRVYMLRQMIDFPASKFITNVCFNSLLVILVASLFPIVFVNWIGDIKFRFFYSSLICLLSTICSVFYVGCSSEERKLVIKKIYKIIKV